MGAPSKWIRIVFFASGCMVRIVPDAEIALFNCREYPPGSWTFDHDPDPFPVYLHGFGSVRNRFLRIPPLMGFFLMMFAVSA